MSQDSELIESLREKNERLEETNERLRDEKEYLKLEIQKMREQSEVERKYSGHLPVIFKQKQIKEHYDQEQSKLLDKESGRKLLDLFS